MEPIVTPFIHGGPLGRVRFKVQPEDFVVEETLGFEPSGIGEHCLVWIEKCDLDSNVVSSRLADALGIRRRLVSHCGLKDRHAITRQWFSIHLPGEDSPDPTSLESEGVRVLQVTRNTRKLRRGTHVGNRFTIRLSDHNFSSLAATERWTAIAHRGVANVYGPQRFGRDGGNVAKALAMFRGEFEPRDRLLRGLFLSSARSYLFNRIVTERLARGIWDKPCEGEVHGFASNRSLILPEKQRGDESERFASGEIEMTAPLWGSGELQSVGEVRALEEEIASGYPELTVGLEAYGLRQERRVMRLRPMFPEIDCTKDDVIVRFDLPKGTYATAILREFADLDENS